MADVCGIAGILERDGRPVSREELGLMSEALAHRGPDDRGIYIDENLGLVHRRLSILDLTSAGHQPMGNEDGSLSLVYNGQLYRFDSTRSWLQARGHRFRSRTDTEVILHLYEEKGTHLLEEIDGMFAFALWDGSRRRLLLARDRLGIKPLYYVHMGSRLAFASELKALTRLPWVSTDIDPASLVQYLYQSSVPGKMSILAGIRKLGPGECLLVEKGSSRTYAYWRLPPEQACGSSVDFDQAQSEFQNLLTSAVQSHMVSDVPVGVFLSGGLDSTAVTQAATRAQREPVHTFSVRFPAEPHLDEGPMARETALALGTIHHELVLDHESVRVLPDVIRQADEPFAVASAVAVYHLARFAREWVKVVLTGDGADEILGGYPWRHEPEIGPRAFLRGLAMAGVRSWRGSRAGKPGLVGEMSARLRRMLKKPGERYTEILSGFIPEELEALVVPELGELVHSAWRDNPVRTAYDREADGDEINRRLRTDLTTTLVDEMLTKVDRMTMAAGLEARVPFLDGALVEWAFRQPGSFKIRGGLGKLLLRKALAESLPRTASRPKHGFTAPLGAWLRGPLREQVRDLLSPEVVRRRGFFRPEAVEKLVTAHLARRGDHGRKVYTLLVLEMWLGLLAGEKVRELPEGAPFAADG